MLLEINCNDKLTTIWYLGDFLKYAIHNFITIINDTTTKVAFALWSKCLTKC